MKQTVTDVLVGDIDGNSYKCIHATKNYPYIPLCDNLTKDVKDRYKQILKRSYDNSEFISVTFKEIHLADGTKDLCIVSVAYN